MKVLIQAGVRDVVFRETYSLEPELEELWNRIAADSGLRLILAPDS